MSEEENKKVWKPTAKQSAFIDAYLSGPTKFNATASAIAAGYSEKTAYSIASELLKHPLILSMIEKLMLKSGDSTDSEFRKTIEKFQEKNIHKKENRKSMFVYFILAANGFVKIGIAGDVRQRFVTLNTSSPIELSLLFFIKSDSAASLEKAFHRIFSMKKARLEWFSLSEADIEWVKGNYEVLYKTGIENG